jgi:hypothetical protein
MKHINIDDIPVLEFDPGIPDARWGETTTGAVTDIVQNIIIMIS